MIRSVFRPFFWVLACMALPPGPRLQAEVLQDDWAKVIMGGGQIGYFHITTEKIQEDGRDIFVTVEETNFSMMRAGIVLKISEKSRTREDESGQVLDFKMERNMGGDLMEVTGKTEAGRIKIVANGVPSAAPYPAGALGPHRIDHEMRQKGFAPGTMSSLPMFNREDPSEAVTVSTVILEKQKMKIGQVEKEWLVSDTTMSHMPGMTIRTWGDDQGNFELIQMPLGGLGTIEMQRSSKEEALQQARPAEIIANTLVKPSRPIPHPEKLKEAVYRMDAPKSGPNTFYSGDGQKVEAKGDGVCEIRVGMPVKPPAEAIFKDAPVQDAAYSAYLKPSSFIQSDDPAVAALARKIAGSESNALILASRIQQGVYLKMAKKNLGTGLASAGLVAKTLEGDCTEHAVLSAAIGRALGLPSRVVAGMVYVPPGSNPDFAGNFGYHMWAEVLVAPDVWWPVDAALGRFDVTHIAMTKTPLEKPGIETQLVLPMLQVIGNLKVEVLETK